MTFAERRDAARKAIGRNVRRLLHEHGVTETEVAARIGHDPNTMYRICNGRRMPSAYTAKRIADAIGCSVDELLEGVAE